MSETVPKDWQKKKLGEIGKFSTSSVDKKINLNEQYVYLLNYMDIYRNSILDESYPFQSITAPKRQISSSNVVSGDVFFTPSSETPDDIGHSCVFIGNIKNLVHSYHTIRYRTHSPKVLDDRFKAYAFKSNDTYTYFRKAATGSTRFTISLPFFKELEVLIPPSPEQKKIASILTSVDEVIENTQKQIDKLQDLKKATMNELLTKGIGHTEFKDSELGRIPKSWEVTFLDNLGNFSKGKGISKKDTSTRGVPCIRYAEIYTNYDYVIKQFRSFISKDKVSTTKKLKKNDIVFAGSGETIADIGKSVSFVHECEAYVGGDTIVFSPIDGVDSTFLSYQLNDDIRRIQLRKLGQGSSIVHIYSSGLKCMRVCLPPLYEQQKIASILTFLEDVIEDKRNKLYQTQSLKKSLMQDLLTGKIRVQVN